MQLISVVRCPKPPFGVEEVVLRMDLRDCPVMAMTPWKIRPPNRSIRECTAPARPGLAALVAAADAKLLRA